MILKGGEKPLASASLPVFCNRVSILRRCTMYRVAQPRSSWIVFVVLALGLLAAPAWAGVYQGAKIEWCWSPTFPDYFPVYQKYFIEVIYPPLGQQVGDTV